MLSDYFSLAFDNLRHRGIRSWLTMLGIFIGIAAVVSLMSLGDGLRTAVTGQFSALSTDILMVQNAQTGFAPPGSASVTKITSHDLKIIESVPNIDIIIPRLLRPVKFEFNKVLGFEFLVSMPNDNKKIPVIYDSFGLKIEEGKSLGAEDKGKVLLGHDFSNINRYDKQIKTGSKVLIQGKEFTVIGIMAPASSFQVNGAILMLEDDAKSLLSIGDEYDFVGVKVSNPDLIEQTAKEISDKLRKDRKEKIGEEDFSVQTPLQSLSAVNTILNIINTIIAGIAGISLLVGGIGIANTMYTSVLERTREIGVMKAIGAQNKNILTIFLIESGLLGLVGGIIGALLGLLFAYSAAGIANQAFGGEIISVSTSYPLLIGAVSFAFILGIAAGILPAFQASKLKPTEALRQ